MIVRSICEIWFLPSRFKIKFYVDFLHCCYVLVNFHKMTLPLILFLIGVLGFVLNRKNVLLMLISVELMLLAVNLNFLVFSVSLDDMMGQLFALLVLTGAAAESAIGLAIFVITFRVRGTIAVEFINSIQG